MFKKRFKKPKLKSSDKNSRHTGDIPSELRQTPLSQRESEDQYTDPDSSLIDYGKANTPGDATVDFGTLERNRVNTQPTYSREFLTEGPYDEIPVDLENLYALPLKANEESPNVNISPRRSSPNDRRPKVSPRLLTKDRSTLQHQPSSRDTTHAVLHEMSQLYTLPTMSNEKQHGENRGLHTAPGDIIASDDVGNTQKELKKRQQNSGDLVLENEGRLRISPESGDVESLGISAFHKQVQEIKEERDTLKNTVRRLSVELSKYQAKYRPVTFGKDSRELVGLPSVGPIPSWLINTKYLAPLFLAYDDQLTAKQQLLNQYQVKLEDLKEQAQVIIEENESLRSKVDKSISTLVPSISLEHQEILEQSRLVLEENQILMEQCDVQQHKSADMAMAYSQQITQLSRKLVATEAKCTDLEKQLADMNVKHVEIKSLMDQTLIESPIHITRQEHESIVSELKQTIQYQKKHHDTAINDIDVKLKAMTIERDELIDKVTSSSSEVTRLEGQLLLTDAAFRKYENHIVELYSTIRGVQKEEITSQQQLAKIIKVAETTAFERDTFAKVAKDQEIETQKAVQKLLAGNVTVGKLEERLKQYKQKAASKLEFIAEQMREMDLNFDTQREEFTREIRHLQLCLQEKEILLQSAEADKDQVEKDLEVMWQAASSENERLKESVRRSYAKIDRAASALDEPNIISLFADDSIANV